MRKQTWAWGAVALLLFAAAPRGAWADDSKHQPTKQTVEESAEVPMNGETANQAQMRAKAEATRNAIMRVVGVFVAAQTMTSMNKLMKDDIQTRCEGFAQISKILEDKQDGDVYRFKAEFAVGLVDVAKILREKGVLRDWRVMVVLPEEIIKRPVPDPAAETVFLNTFIKAGFKVIDQKRSAELRAGDVARLKDPAIAAELARKMGADILLTGECFAEEGAPFGGISSCQARVEVKAILTDTAEIIAADANMGNGAALTPAIAGKTALQRTAEQLAPRFLNDILLIPASNLRKLKLDVGIFKGFTDADDFEEALKKLEGVRKVNREDYTDGLAKFEVQVDDALAKTLPRLLEKDDSMKPFGLKVKSWTITGGRAEVQ